VSLAHDERTIDATLAVLDDVLSGLGRGGRRGAGRGR